MTTAKFLLRCMEVGINLRDLDLVTIGMVTDIYAIKNEDIEKENSGSEGSSRMATQEDFDKF